MSKNNGKSSSTTTTAMTRTAPRTMSRPALGAELAKMDPEELDRAFMEKKEELAALADDESLPEETRAAIVALHTQASPVKPGMDEVVINWKIPEIKIVQATTVAASKPEASRLGDLFSSAGEALTRPFNVIPVHLNYENVMFPEAAKRPECQAPDAKLGRPYGECAKCPHLPFGQQNGGRGEQKKTDCNNQIVAAVLAADLSQLYLVRFAKTSRKAGSALVQLSAAQPVLWKQSYALSTEKGQGTGNYHIFKVAPTGKDNPPHVMRVAQAVCELYTADRRRKLADHYRGAGLADDAAASAEADFERRKRPGGDAEPYDMGEQADYTTSVRGSSKPM